MAFQAATSVTGDAVPLQRRVTRRAGAMPLLSWWHSLQRCFLPFVWRWVPFFLALFWHWFVDRRGAVARDGGEVAGVACDAT